MKVVSERDAILLPRLAWPVGDFYVPGFASDDRTGLVPGAPDTHRRFFLVRAAELEPELFSTLRNVSPDDEHALSAWGERWNLTDRWCFSLAKDTRRWWTNHPDTQGWEFQRQGIAAGYFPFRIEPLQLGPFYYDPTWRRRKTFKQDILKEINQAIDAYCDGVEVAALSAGLKRAPRHRDRGHFDWLARYQIKGESFASIAKQPSYKFKGGRQTVRKAITELAKYLELTLRPSTSA